MLRRAGCLGYLGMLAVLFGLVAYVAFNLFVRRGVTPVPELYGLPEAEAAALLADQGLAAVRLDDGEHFDGEVPAGHVLQQRPRAGTLVKRGSTVSVALSRGPQRVPVPSVVGQAPQAAQVTLAAAGLNVGRLLNLYSEDSPSGTVTEQRPAPGEPAEHGGSVDLFVSQGSATRTFVMPDLIRQQLDDVRRFFATRDFRIGRVSFEAYAGVPPGTVLRQFPLAGHPLRRGDVISLGVVAPEPSAGTTAEEEGEQEP